MRPVVALIAIPLAVAMYPSNVLASGFTDQKTSATNDGTAVHVGAEQVSTSGGTSPRVRRAVVDYAAQYEELVARMEAEAAKEQALRDAEAARWRELHRIRDECAAQLAALEGVPGLLAEAARRAYADCVARAEAAILSHYATATARREAWNAMWAALNREAHAVWRILNTACSTLEPGLQECRYGPWRNYSPGTFNRSVGVGSARPPQETIQQAFDSVTPPVPVIRMNPRVEWEQIVHVPSWLWLEPATWRTETARADAGDAWAEAHAVPRHVVWDMGNGDRVICPGPGTPYDESRPEAHQRTDCSYTYGQSSAGQPGDAYTVRATVVYDVSWTGSDGSGGDLGTISRADTARVRVAELQALNT